MLATSNDAVRAEDVFGVTSRIKWGPLLAAAAVSVAVYFLLTLLGTAIGLSVGDRVSGEALGTGAVVWAVLTTAVALFVGGYLASQLSVGETRAEAMVYGVVVWAAVFAMLMWLMASGVRAGYTAVVGMANVAANTDAQSWEDAARRAGVPQERIDQARESVRNAPADARQAANDPANRQMAAENATKAAWWAFAGTLLSMLAAVGGAVAGAGPAFRILPTARVVSARETVSSRM
jgi:hypothetical protein